MKRIFSILLALSVFAAMAASCGGNNDTEDTKDSASDTAVAVKDDDTEKVTTEEPEVTTAAPVETEAPRAIKSSVTYKLGADEGWVNNGGEVTSESDGTKIIYTSAGTTSYEMQGIEGAVDYTLEFKAKTEGNIISGTEVAIELNQTNYRLHLYFDNDQIRIVGVGNWSDVHKFEVDTSEWHTYKIDVTNEKDASIYIDGVIVGVMELRTNGNVVNNFKFFGKAVTDALGITVDYVTYTIY